MDSERAEEIRVAVYGRAMYRMGFREDWCMESLPDCTLAEMLEAMRIVEEENDEKSGARTIRIVVADRQIRRLEIEKEALKKESEASEISTEQKKRIKDRLKAIAAEIGELRETTSALETKWSNEREALDAMGRLKKELEELRLEAESAEAMADLTRAAEIRYDSIPSVERELETHQKRLKKLQRSRRLLKEEVTEEEVSETDKRRLEELGFLWMEEEECWGSFRFGSA